MRDIDFIGQANEIGIDKDTLISLYRLYISQTEKDLELLTNAVSDKNKQIILSIAHNIKGSSLNLELTEFSNMAHEIETLAKEETWLKIQEIYNLFLTSFKKLKLVITEETSEYK